MDTVTDVRMAVRLSGPTAAAVGRALVHVSQCASTDPARTSITAVRVAAVVDPDNASAGTVLTFTATDSYRLIHATVPLSADDTLTAFTDPLLIDARQAGKAGKLVTKKNRSAGVMLSAGADGFTLSTSDGSVTAALESGTFPDFDRLMATENTGELPRVNADLMAGLLSAMAGVLSDSRGAVVPVQFDTVGGTMKPIRLSASADGVRVVGLLMPIRR